MTFPAIPRPSASDPGRSTGGGVYTFRPPCAAPCGHPADYHAEGTKACSVADPDKCPCRKYVPTTSPEGNE